jgi:hypothetical protein
MTTWAVTVETTLRYEFELTEDDLEIRQGQTQQQALEEAAEALYESKDDLPEEIDFDVDIREKS